MIVNLATAGKAEDIQPKKSAKKKILTAIALGRKGGKVRAEELTPEERSKIARMGGKNRWPKGKDTE
jgi:hypothetical protein